MNKKFIINFITNLITCAIYYSGIFLISSCLIVFSKKYYNFDTINTLLSIFVIILFGIALFVILTIWYKFIFYTEKRIKNYMHRKGWLCFY
jgi:hypothetical protein